MAGLSDVYENRILNHALRGVDFDSPANVYVDLATGDPGEDGLSNAISGDGHTRAKLGSGGVTTMSDATGLFTTVNNGVITFTQLTANKGTATRYTLWESLSGGTFIGSGTIPGAGVALNDGDTPTIAAGILDIRMPGGVGSDGFGKIYAGLMLNHIFRNATFAAPTNGWWAWFLSDPGELGTSGEVSDAAYARIQIGTGGAEFSEATAGSTDNDDLIQTDASGAGNFGDISHYAVFDDVSDTDMMILKGAADVVRNILSGESIKVQAGAAIFALD